MEPGTIIGPADRQLEGTYRRGYHQAVAMVGHALRANPALTAEELFNWVEGEGMKWRRDVSLNHQVVPPKIG